MIVRRDLKGKKPSVCRNVGPPVESETGNCPRTVNSTVSNRPFFARSDNPRAALVNQQLTLLYRERWRRRKARRLMRVFVEPEADRVLWLHVRVLLVLDQGETAAGR